MATQRLDLIHHSLSRPSVPAFAIESGTDVVHDYPCAFARHGQGDVAANATARACDYGHLALQNALGTRRR
ncbi:hypothetical protein D3C87_1976930 [compost metagenome]